MTTSFEKTASRVTYQLSFRQAPREFGQDMLVGPRIPNARGQGQADGDWVAGDAPDEDADAETWLAHMAHMAVGEAVHEALEWLQVDGSPWLDPHGPAEFNIHDLVVEFCAKLAVLRARCLADPDTTVLARTPPGGENEEAS